MRRRSEGTIRIHIKLLLFFASVILLFAGVSAFILSNQETALNRYDQIIRRLLLLNEISWQTDQMMPIVSNYMNDPSAETEARFTLANQQLQQKRSELASLENRSNFLTVRNYENMIGSFLEQADAFMRDYKRNEIERYTSDYEEMAMIARFVKETTLDLIDNNLTGYQLLYEQLKAKEDDYRRLMVSLLLTSILLMALVMLLFAQSITRPIRRLEQAARLIGQGDFSGEDVQVASKDEMQVLAHAFNLMKHNLRQHVQTIRERAEMERLLQEAELKSLQSQINPHFLFNTLNTISKLAYLEGAEETSELIESVSSMLRYSLRKLDQSVTIAEEVEHVKNYFYIQQKRFGDRVTMEIAVDPACRQLPVPNLTLQPLVENAFIHGIDDMEQGARIAIRIYPQQGNCVIEVEDNGKGMSDELQAQLMSLERQTIRQGHSTGLGLHNVLRRLALFYGDRVKWEIRSAVGAGTLIRLQFPMAGKEVGSA